MSRSAKVTLNSESFMPLIGLGTWQSKPQSGAVEKAVDYALSIGYRHIDTAFYYKNEDEIGKVLKKYLDSGKIKREELFIVTKLPVFGMQPSEVEKYLDLSLKALQLEYVDLYLIHVPMGYILKEDGSLEMDLSTDLAGLWQEMEKQVDAGKTKTIGVSNFSIEQVERLLKVARIKPVTNQVELHAYLQQKELVEHHKRKDIVVTAYSPLGSLGMKYFVKQLGRDREIPNIMRDPVVVQIAEKYKKTPAQILLKHIIQKGISVIPKSENPERIKENINILDFQLNSTDMKKLDDLDCNNRIFDFFDFLPEVDKHPEYPFKK